MSTEDNEKSERIKKQSIGIGELAGINPQYAKVLEGRIAERREMKNRGITREVGEFTPDFLLCPYKLFEDEELTPLDRTIYSVVYWFSEMKDGVCFASNETIARIAKCSPGSVTNSVIRLRRAGYVKASYEEETGHRVWIKAMVRYRGG